MDLDEERNPQNYHTYENHRRFLYGEELEDRKANRAQRQIVDNQLPGLADRCQHLIDDIALLHKAGYLDTEYWADGWNQVTELNPRLELEAGTGTEESPVWLPFTELEGETRLGFAFGRMLRRIGNGLEPNISEERMMWGIILGYLGESYSAQFEERKRIEDLLESISGRVAQRENGLSREWLPHALINYAKKDKERLVNQYINAEAGRQMTVTESGDKLDIEISLPFDPEEDKEFLELSLFDEFIETSQIKANSYIKLYKSIHISSTLLEISSYHTIKYRDAFHDAWMASGYIYGKNLKTQNNTGKRTISKIMNDLSGDGVSERWKGRPPLFTDETSSSDVGRKWSLTDYGDLVGRSLFEEDGFEVVYGAIGRLLIGESVEEDLQNDIEDALREFQDS